MKQNHAAILLVISQLLILRIALAQDRFGPKILGGLSINIKEAPYQVSLGTSTTPHFCGGSIINERYILTAAHCFNNIDLKDVIIRAGITGRYDTHGQFIPLENVVIHPGFCPISTVDYDIAVVKLSKPLIFNDIVKPIELNDDPNNICYGGLAQVTGWGYKKEDAEIGSDKLLTTSVPLISAEECKDYFTPGLVTSNMICAGFKQGGFDSCDGDSGGPLVYNNRLVGVVSFGMGCGRPEQPGIYINVAKFKDFITSAMKSM